MRTELSVNVDHIATLRQARGGREPDPVEAAVLSLDAGAAGITVHLREDHRHIQDEDLRRLRALRRGVLNLEMALTEDMLRVAADVKPDRATLVPEKRQELTTEGGLDIRRDPVAIRDGCARLREAGVTVSLFLDPDREMIEAARATGAEIVELHTGAYANAWGTPAADAEIERLSAAALDLERHKITPHAGHGLTVANVGPLLRRYPFRELSIGHSLVSRAVIVGTSQAVREMLQAIRAA